MMIHLRLLFLLVCLAALAACETTVKAAEETETTPTAAAEVKEASKRSGISILTLETNAGSPPSQTKNTEKDAEERRLEGTGSSQEKKGTETATVMISKGVQETCSEGGTGQGKESCPTLTAKPRGTQRDGNDETSVERKPKVADVIPEVKPAKGKSEETSAAEKSEVKSTAAKPDVKSTAAKPDVKSTAAKPDVKLTASKSDLKLTAEKSNLKLTAEKSNLKLTAEKPEVKLTEAKPEVKSTEGEPEIKRTAEKSEIKSHSVKDTSEKPLQIQTPEINTIEKKHQLSQLDVKRKVIKSAEISEAQEKVPDIKSNNAKPEHTKTVKKTPKEKQIERDHEIDTLQVDINGNKPTVENHPKESPEVKPANRKRVEDNTSQTKPSEFKMSVNTPPKNPSPETKPPQPKPQPKTNPSEPKALPETKSSESKPHSKTQPSEPKALPETKLSEPKPLPETKLSEQKLTETIAPEQTHLYETNPPEELSETKSDENIPEAKLKTKPQEASSGKASSGKASSKSDVNIPNVDGLDRAERPARILAVAPYNARSHFVMFGLLFRALAARGHQIDVVSHFPATDPPEGYTDLSVNGSFPSWEDNVDLESVDSLNALTDAAFLWYETLNVCATVLEHPNVQKLLRSGEKYDLVISEIFGADCLAGFAYKHRAPLVGVVSSTALPWALDRVGSPDHPAYTSNYFLPFVPPMSFWQRGVNALYGAAIRRLKALLCDRANDALVRRYFGEDLPSTSEIVGRTSLILINSHPVSNQPRPFVPAVVEVGGLHIGEPKPLPEDLERLVSGARDGVVLFSLGTMMKLSSLPVERLSALWSALGALPQLVLLKSRDELPGVPPNVHIRAWLPQFDLLCHPNVVLFVTHGGLMGTQEAVWAGVPMLGIPFFADQRLNLRTYETKGVALLLEHHEITCDRLSHALHRLISDDRFRMNAQALSVQFRDRPSPPLRSAVWWVEYVLRHQGAPHLRSASADMPWYQLLLLDVFAAVAAVAVLAAAVAWVMLSSVYRAIRFGSARPKTRKPIVDTEGRPKRYTKTKQH